ncbi:GGDEF domain-containing protein [Maridesulfovibrio sp.]|uniref:GGDEF domain-containing protein n=1 Tax=Maridesulfovibrio sp. TaxID=2795000 RepID=UPI003AFF7C3C
MSFFSRFIENTFLKSYHAVHDKYRIKVLRALMIVCLFLLSIEALSFYYTENYFIAYSEAVFIVILYLFSRRMWQNTRIFGTFFTVTFFVIWCMISMWYIDDIRVWMFSLSFPVFFVFFLGLRKGVSVTIVYFLPLVLSFFHYYQESGQLPISTNIFIVYCFTAIYIGVLTVAFELTNKFLLCDLKQRAELDELTGLYSRRMFFDLFKHDLAQAERLSFNISLLLMDIDHFKSINDTHGHPVGDEVLKCVAGTFCKSIRKNDTLGRIGGEEFACMLPAANAQEAAVVADKMRNAIMELNVENLPQCTISVGVTGFIAGDSVSSMYKRADQALYKAKAAGRNCTAIGESSGFNV